MGKLPLGGGQESPESASSQKRWALVSFQKSSEAKHCCGQRNIEGLSDHSHVNIRVRPIANADKLLSSTDGEKYVVSAGVPAGSGGGGCDDESSVEFLQMWT
eukprot:COSAG05_NODE_16127_length_353_cov_0.610236_1_plen_101_part_10